MSSTILRKETYLKMIENSIDSRTFNSLFVKDENGKVLDVLGDGNKSCAVFVSSILTLNGLIDGPHATVETLVKVLEEHGYELVAEEEKQPGDIIRWDKWENVEGLSDNHHIGFYLGDNEAVSTIWQEKKVCKHHCTYGVDDNGNHNRKILAVYRPPKL